MNYRHSYHAGNFADVFKHTVLSLLLQTLRAKEKPFCYLDTHAGAGLYDLHSTHAQKTGEYQQGIGCLWGTQDVPQEMTGYLAAVHAANAGDALRFYPGSPRIARHFLRPQDRMVLIELHSEEAHALKQEFRGDAQVHVHVMDGFLGLKGFLPPPERRGMVLIDPPFERADDFEQLVEGLKTAHQRWSTGIYALWYPLNDRQAVQRFHQQLVASGLRKLLLVEIQLHAEPLPGQLFGCGMIIMNSPWCLDGTLQNLLPKLMAGLHAEKGRARVEWLVPE